MTSQSSHRVADLVPSARRCSDEAFERTLGHPVAALVGPPRGQAAAWDERVTRASTPVARMLRSAEFAHHEVYLVFAPPSGATAIGRGPANDVVVPDDSVSQRHAVLRRSGDAFAVDDLGSRNGTLVDGALVLPGRPISISFGQTLQLGSRIFKLYRIPQLRKTLRHIILEQDS